MGIIDRDYMKRDTNKKNRKSTYRQNAYTDSNTNNSIEAEWWDGENWKKSIQQQRLENDSHWVRPWLWQVFIFMLVMFGIHKGVEFSKEVRAKKAQEQLLIQIQEQQEAARQAQAYRSPYADMPILPEYTRPHSEPQKPKTEAQPAPLMRAPERPPSIIVSEGVTVLEGSRDGHYFSSGTVNGFPVVFMVDTGATTVSISMETAARAGIQECTQARFRTANGDTDGCKAVVPILEFGNYKISNVEVAIMKNLTAHSLLGMNVLKLFKMQQHENRLFFSPNT